PEGAHQAACLQFGEGDVEVAWEPVLQRAVEKNLLQLVEQVGAQLFAQLENPPGIGRHFRFGQLGRFAEADDPRDIESAGAQTSLVPASIDERRQVGARIAADVKRSHALGSVDFVRADGDQVRLHFIDLERDFSDALNRIAVEQNASLA